MAAPGTAPILTPRELSFEINDLHFMRDLKLLRKLRSFFLQEAITIGPDDPEAMRFDELNLFRYGEHGREPTRDEWFQVEKRTQLLFQLLNEPLRRRFLLGQIPLWVAVGPIILAALAAAALYVGGEVQGAANASGASVLPFYLIWLVCLGAIGSVAFIGMNALSVQQDITFDLSNRRLMLLRIVLGALFGLVLSLPIGFPGFMQFLASIAKATPTSDLPSAAKITQQTGLLLMPFILGFSTSLVIMILNRLVDAVQAFFGKGASSDKKEVGAPGAPRMREA